jgi:hypothetical protein
VEGRSTGGPPLPASIDVVAELLARVDSETLVDHQTFDLLDDGGPQRARVDFGARTQWLFVGDNAVTVLSASNRHHVATVVVEAWDTEPEIPADWSTAASATGRLRLDSGLVEVNPLIEGDDGEALVVGPPGPYDVRAFALGRDEIVRLSPPPDVELRGVERYLFQFWPAPA